MIDWKTYFTKDIKNWLLEGTNPSVRYLTLVDLLNKSEQSKEVQFAKKLIMETDPVKRILSNQNLDGSFLNKKLKQNSPTIDPKNGYQPKYRGTIWQALFLADLGADKDDQRIKKLCEYILDTNYYPQIEVLGLKFLHSKRAITTIPCYVANMVWAISKLGYYNDFRVQKSIKWLLKYQRFDDGDFKTPNEWPYRGRADRCFGKHSCYIGSTQTLRAMTVISKDAVSKEFNRFIQKAIDYILLHKIYKRSRGKDQLIKKDYEYLAFPSFYYDDIIGILNSLLFFKVKDQAINDAIEFLLSKRTKTGKWILEKTIQPTALHAKFEEKGVESKWITFRVLNVLKKYNEIESE
ncbi:MAG: hypothetical protein KAJ51_04060 [Thermoplasmata archaeon]|nr:hypothetical protein [Thermoplasmata archaeon]